MITTTELQAKREKLANGLARCQKSLASLDKYLDSLAVQHLEVASLDKVLETCETSGGRLDAQKAQLTSELNVVDCEIAIESARLRTPHEDDKLRTKVAVGLFAPSAKDVEIALIYAVPFASWTALYDIRVDMDTKENPVTLIYKAAVEQNTGECWDDVPLQLETSTPTFGLDIPELSPWNLHIYQPAFKSSKSVGRGASQQSAPPSGVYYRSRTVPHTSEVPEEESEVPMDHAGAAVSSKGNVSATFRVPGLVTIPCDGDVHNFTIVELSLKAVMSWVCVPKIDTKTHLKARVTNASEYTLLEGTASVYVDGSFISRSVVPAVSPQESFDCPLGIDTSIRVTYHPVIKKLSHSGFVSRSANHLFSQRITVFNTKSVGIDQLKIIDHVPTSQNSAIEVKLTNPALTVPSIGEGTSKNAPKEPQVVKVAKGVKAQWDGVDEPGCEIESLGLDRKLNWICTVPAQGKMNLALEWEVNVTPASTKVVGL
ncbi:hypothetical protein FB45DRAFT_1116673 [Roridomyces roridus]|uniref:DUF4139 domain-containing protein n=1 Tax=Roridomyces roridus TaxID=1738132 RepID=A0AAD7CC82_9AGAR|nr:hypothetical protein FB45DRAFT_1116673 [Roridomyces roridus]